MSHFSKNRHFSRFVFENESAEMPVFKKWDIRRFIFENESATCRLSSNTPLFLVSAHIPLIISINIYFPSISILQTSSHWYGLNPQITLYLTFAFFNIFLLILFYAVLPLSDQP